VNYTLILQSLNIGVKLCARSTPDQVSSCLSGHFEPAWDDDQGPDFLFLRTQAFLGRAFWDALYSVLRYCWVCWHLNQNTKQKATQVSWIYLQEHIFSRKCSGDTTGLAKGYGSPHAWPWTHPCSEAGFSPWTSKLTQIFLTHLTGSSLQPWTQSQKKKTQAFTHH